MRNVVFVSGNQLHTASPIDLNALPANTLCLCYYDKDGVRRHFDANASKFRWLNTFHVVVKSTISGVSTMIDIPVCKPGLQWVKSEYRADTKLNATITVTAPTLKGEYTIIVVKKGAVNDERYKYSSSVYIDRTTTTAAELATKLAKDITAKCAHLKLKAVANAATITFTCENSTDFELVPADNLTGVAVNYTSRGLRGQNDEEYVKDLLRKHAANQGFMYPADGADMYPGYDKVDLNLISPNKQFAVYTLNFVNTRDVETHGDSVRQLLHIVCPSTRSFTAAFEDILNQAN